MSINAQSEKLSFQTEVKQLLHLVTHALYSNKEIFLRELISNASDAADKLRYQALADAALYEADPELKIWIEYDDKARTVTIRDNGIGMSREEVIQNLGTIAKSGTREFIEAITAKKEKEVNLIGQFGVGFYSAFIVADKVVVKTRRAGMQPEQGVKWESAGEGDYVVENIVKPERGTEIILHLKKDEDEFLDGSRLRHIITKYSDHILLPIVMQKPVAATEESQETKVTEPQTEIVNSAKALWTLPKNQIKDEEYKELYKHIAHDFADPLLWAHNQVEGKLEYISLLYIPAHAPFDIWNREQFRGLKLYVRRVFIMDDAQQLLPNYLRFVRGIVDSNDLPLNISREILQNNKVIDGIRGGLIKRILSMLDNLAKDNPVEYQKFWKEFGQILKEGTAEDLANKEAIAKLLRFSSTHSDSAEQNVSLDDYVSRMQAEQDKIFYVTADNYIAAKNSPHLEIFSKKNIEVLLLTDRIDEWLVVHLPEYNGKKLVSVAKGALDFAKPSDAKTETEQKEMQTQFEDLLKKMQEVLGEKVKEVRLSERLTDSPVCLVADENEMGIHLQRILQAAGQNVPKSQPIMEINPEHAIIKQLNSEKNQQHLTEWTNILFDQSLLAEGSQLEDPAGFVKRLNTLLLQLSEKK